jgi:BASS family bile acid:Na+ symporter
VGWWAGKERLAAVRPRLKLASATVLLLLNYANASLALPQVVADFHPQRLSWLVAVTLGVCATTFLSGWLLARAGRLEPAARHSLVFGIGMKNTGIALTLAALWVESQPLATVAIIAYTLTQHMLAAGYHARVPREEE